MTHAVMPLEIIREKERDIRRRIEAARRQSESEIQAARAEAARIVRQADEEARAQAEADYRAEIEHTRQQASEIYASATAQAEALTERAQTNLPRAVDELVRLTLPRE